MRCLGFKLPAEGVTTAVPHTFKLIKGLSDPSLMHQWRQAGTRTDSTADVSSLDISSPEASSEDVGSDDPQSPVAKSPSSTSSSTSSEHMGPIKRPAAATAAGVVMEGAGLKLSL